MSTLLRIIGWIAVAILVLGSPQVIAREGIHFYTLIPLAFYILIAWLCFWGAKRLNKNKENSKKEI